MSPAHIPPFFVVTDAAGKPLGAYHRRQQVGTKLRWTPDGRAFHWARDTGLVEVTETFWWGCFNLDLFGDPGGRWGEKSVQVPGRIYRSYR